MATGGRSRRATARLDDEAAARLRADLGRFFARRTRDRELAEDLTQQAILQLVRGLVRFRGAAALRTWARRIATNVWRDHLRRQATRPATRSAQAAEGVAGADGAPDQLGRTPAARAEAIHDRIATHDCLLDAVRRLPVEARRILLLHDLGDMPLRDAAAALGCSPGAAKVRLHRARRRLAERCRAECVSEPGSDGEILCTPKQRGKGRSGGGT